MAHRDHRRRGRDEAARALTYLVAAISSVLMWAIAERFGGLYPSGSSGIATVICAVVFVSLLAFSCYAGPARYSADHSLERRFSSRWRLTGLRRPLVADLALVPLTRAGRPAAHCLKEPPQP